MSSSSAVSALPSQAQLSAFGQSVIRYAQTHPFTTTAAGLALYYAQTTYADYRSWLSIGLGGTSHGPFGYFMARLYGLLNNPDIFSTIVYKSADSTPRYLPSDFPVRTGERPPVSRWAFPVRQLSTRSPANLRGALDETLDRVVAAGADKHGNRASVCKAPSELEGGYSSALFVTPKKADAQKIECFHLHGFEGSAHALLSEADARVLLDAGWGERHPLSGQLFFGAWKDKLPLSYVMVYAPRSEEEVAVHEMVARASMEYAAEQ